jgi:hypothetical protein
MKQFHGLYYTNDGVEHPYVMGHRLLSFLQTALPKHPEYMSSSVTQQRNRTFRDLEWISHRMEELALKIDEEQLNRFIANDFDPSDNDDDDDDNDEDSSSDSSCSITWTLADLEGSNVTGGTWESFQGWSFDISTEAHESMNDVSRDSKATAETCSETDEEDERYESDFLRKIAQEDVLYETDSDAADSWAQEEDCHDAASSVVDYTTTCDPARIAFRDIMNHIPQEQGYKKKETWRASLDRLGQTRVH